MKTVRFPLAFSIESRIADFNKDSRITNGYVDTEGERKWIFRRPGTSVFTTNPSLPVSQGQGLFPFNGSLFAVVNNTLYKITTAGVVTTIGTVGAGTHYFSSTSQAPYLFIHNTITGWTYNATTGIFAQVTNSGFPCVQGMTLVPGAVYLDDYTFVMTTTGRIYVSDVENPTAWDEHGTNPTGAYISKTSEPDLGTAVVKHLNWLIAFGQWSSEFYYNAGNATGSPLLRNDTAKCELGCVNGDTVVQFAQTVAFLGQARETGRGVYLFEGVAPTKVSTAAVDRYLNASTLSSAKATAVTIAGHTFYLLTLNDIGMTLVYDMVEKLWYHWSSNSSGVNPIFYCDPTYVTPTMAAGAATNYVETLTVVPSTIFEYINQSSVNGVAYFQDKTYGNIVTFSTNVYQDSTKDMEFIIRTKLIDANSNKYKFWFSLELIGDRTPTIMQLRWSDDDYNTWSAYRQIDMNQERPIFYQLGSARRRALELYSVSNSAIRLQDNEVAVKEGTV